VHALKTDLFPHQQGLDTTTSAGKASDIATDDLRRSRHRSEGETTTRAPSPAGRSRWRRSAQRRVPRSPTHPHGPAFRACQGGARWYPCSDHAPYGHRSRRRYSGSVLSTFADYVAGAPKIRSRKPIRRENGRLSKIRRISMPKRPCAHPAPPCFGLQNRPSRYARPWFYFPLSAS
jgi:hypothetical protein